MRARGGNEPTSASPRPLLRLFLAIALAPTQLIAQPGNQPPATDVLCLFGNEEFYGLAAVFAAQAKAASKRTELLSLQTPAKRSYVDELLRGRDHHAPFGVETASLVFHVGHGGFSDWDTHPTRTVSLDEVQFGDLRLRYLWLLSCRVMAHGRSPYDAPHEFASTASAVEQNVFERWGRRYPHQTATTTPLAPKLRMACGGSTRLDVPTPDTIKALWTKVATEGPPSDTFIEQFRADPQPATETSPLPIPARVPLCITRGSSDPTSTPLYDEKFVEAANGHGSGEYLFIQYPITVVQPTGGALARTVELLVTGSASNADGIIGELDDPGLPPLEAPVLRMAPLPLPPQLLAAFLEEDARAELGFRRLSLGRVLQVLRDAGAGDEVEPSIPLAAWAGDAAVYFHPCSGALFLRGPSTAGMGAPQHPCEGPLPEVEDDPLAVLRALREPTEPSSAGVAVRAARSFRRIDMCIDRVSQASLGETGSIHRTIKHHRIEVSSAVALPGRLHPVIGEGGDASVDVAPNGWPFAASLTTRRIAGCRDAACEKEFVLPYEAARVKAFARAVEFGARFQAEPAYTWGYLEAPATCYQREMGIVHRFTFEPFPEERSNALVVDVPAQKVEPWICPGEREGEIPETLPAGCELESP